MNFPHNPTGAVPDKGTWGALVELCDERGIHLFSDEVYRGLELNRDTTLAQGADLSPKALSLNVLSKAYGLPGLRIGWIACRDPVVLDRLERAKQYTSICNSAPSEILGLIAVRAGDELLEKNRQIIAHNLLSFNAFFSRRPDLFQWQEPQGGCVAYPRYLGSEGVESLCTQLVEEAGVLLLPASVYHSSLTTTPDDRFRVGVGRGGPQEDLDVWAAWLDTRRRA